MEKLPEEEKPIPEEEEIPEETLERLNSAEEKALMSVEELEGLGTVTAKALENAGIKYVVDLVVRDSVELAELTSLTRVACDKIVQQAREVWIETEVKVELLQESFIGAT